MRNYVNYVNIFKLGLISNNLASYYSNESNFT